MSINRVTGLNAVGFGSSEASAQPVATVQVGEITISDVANRLKVDKEALLQANTQIKDAYQKLNAGQELSLPQTTDSTAVTEANDATVEKTSTNSRKSFLNATCTGTHFKEGTIEVK